MYQEKLNRRKEMQQINNEIFARKNQSGNYDILYVADGYPVTRLDCGEFPVNSKFGSRYEHPEGIEFALEQVEKLGIQFE
jgi:hypothetical protein